MKRIWYFSKKILCLSFILIQLPFSAYKIHRLRRKLNTYYPEILLWQRIAKTNKDINELKELKNKANEIEKKIVAISDKYRTKMKNLRFK
jgi:hypothetical protein